MQTRTVINKIRWIRAQLSDELEQWLFLSTESEEGGSLPISTLFAMVHDSSRFAEVVSRDAASLQILRAFGLGLLADREELLVWLQGRFAGSQRHGPRDDIETERPHEGLPRTGIIAAWETMISSVDAIEKLTTPEEMQTTELPETFISFELVSSATENTPLSRLAKATVFAEEAYETVCRAYQTNGARTLAVVKIDSGSNIRIDCKGLGEPVKHLKDLILEAWHKVRHKRAEEVLENNKAIFDSLAVIERINAGERDGALSGVEAEQLRRKIFTSVGGLFECGALIAEIPSQETVENTKLLGDFSPKLLPPPKAGSEAGTKKAVRKKAARKKTTPKKRSSTRKAARKKTTSKKRSSTRRKT